MELKRNKQLAEVLNNISNTVTLLKVHCTEKVLEKLIQQDESDDEE